MFFFRTHLSDNSLRKRNASLSQNRRWYAHELMMCDVLGPLFHMNHMFHNTRDDLQASRQRKKKKPSPSKLTKSPKAKIKIKLKPKPASPPPLPAAPPTPPQVPLVVHAKSEERKIPLQKPEIPKPVAEDNKEHRVSVKTKPVPMIPMIPEPPTAAASAVASAVASVPAQSVKVCLHFCANTDRLLTESVMHHVSLGCEHRHRGLKSI